jgi:aminoglycoside phosphotransferase/phosphate uptake regulator
MIGHVSQGVNENLRFLIAEVSSQLANLQIYFATGSISASRQILDRSGYAHNLKSRIHESCLKLMADSGQQQFDAQLLRSMESIASHLERITALSRDIIQQMGQLERRSLIRKKAYLPLLKKVTRGVNLVEHAIERRRTSTALKIGAIKRKLDRGYSKLYRHYTTALKQQQQPQDLVIALSVAHRVELMGEALLNISEALISVQLGMPVNTQQYHSLHAAVEELEERPLEKLTIRPIAETRSGSGISGISDSSDGDYVAIYKDGNKQKLKEERQGLESWHRTYPGLAPQVISYQKQGKSASLLIEHLPGATFEQVLLNQTDQQVQSALKQLKRTLRAVWHETKTEKQVSANYMQQLSKRLKDVYSIHPKFRQQPCMIGQLRIRSLAELIEQATQHEARIKAPFSVYIHGDFNLDNIIYNPAEQRINFIDLHRSKHSDYVQDISVFMVSNYRLQILDQPLRQRSMALVIAFYRFASRYARTSGDKTFELRLALALARSFVTSTRFILDRTLTQNMFMRSRYLLERVIDTPAKKIADFQLPIKELFSV